LAIVLISAQTTQWIRNDTVEASRRAINLVGEGISQITFKCRHQDPVQKDMKLPVGQISDITNWTGNLRVCGLTQKVGRHVDPKLSNNAWSYQGTPRTSISTCSKDLRLRLKMSIVVGVSAPYPVGDLASLVSAFVPGPTSTWQLPGAFPEEDWCAKPKPCAPIGFSKVCAHAYFSICHRINTTLINVTTQLLLLLSPTLWMWPFALGIFTISLFCEQCMDIDGWKRRHACHIYVGHILKV
jgi:hypothetical protein